MPGMLIWEGPSEHDGAPIALVATWGSRNEKTGPLVQTWILRADVAPMDAVRAGLDSSVCGQCPQRWFLGGSCYVLPFMAPRWIYKAYKRGKYEPTAKLARKLRAVLADHKLRMGAYGDPGMVPSGAWVPLLEIARVGHLGYTHQWQNPIAAGLRKFCMASVDSEAEEFAAREMGWRTFRSRHAGESIGAKTVECLSDSRGLSCEACGICDGANDAKPNMVSVWIETHGARANRKLLPVVR